MPKAVDILTGEEVDVKFFDNYRVPINCTVEKEDHSSVTETAYVPPQVQIADMMLAGIRLAEERRARFDSVELEIPAEEDIPLDPLREPGLDLVDMQRAFARVAAPLARAQEEANRKAQEAKDAEQKAALEAAVKAELELRGKA